MNLSARIPPESTLVKEMTALNIVVQPDNAASQDPDIQRKGVDTERLQNKTLHRLGFHT